MRSWRVVRAWIGWGHEEALLEHYHLHSNYSFVGADSGFQKSLVTT